MIDFTNKTANEAISKFKLLSAYGGPGSIVHTEYGSIIISCIEEWGFIQKIGEFINDASKLQKNELEHVREQVKINDLILSNDDRLLQELKSIKLVSNLKYLVLIPDIELNDVFKTIKNQKASLAINSTFMPKGFFDSNNNYKEYKNWYDEWPSNDQPNFFPPKYKISKGEKSYDFLLKQDNIVLICGNGHISDFPWSKFLRWRTESPDDIYNKVDLFNRPDCCNKPLIQIRDTTASASGFDGKWLRCANKGCQYSKGVSLKGLMSVKIVCAGHKPWEVDTGEPRFYNGKKDVRRQDPKRERCISEHMKVALTTGNNLYFSRILSSIYMPSELFLGETEFQIKTLNSQLEDAMKRKEFQECIRISDEIKLLESRNKPDDSKDEITDSERELNYRYQEFKALAYKRVPEINIVKDLKVEDITQNLIPELERYFTRILRVDNLKVTSAQLDFSRSEPSDSDKIESKNIFRSNEANVMIYPVVENYGEGIFFAINEQLLNTFTTDTQRFTRLINKDRNEFAKSSVNIARVKNWQLYLVHTLCHLIMRELEFRCGYPTASLSERIFSSNEESTRMHGFLVYTAEGAEGSMGGLIAQTRKANINNLIKSAIKRATVCNSDPLCWQSDGQGLFELNLASCFSCCLVSETSCEQRNLFLDRRILVDEMFGFFKDLL